MQCYAYILMVHKVVRGCYVSEVDIWLCGLVVNILVNVGDYQKFNKLNIWKKMAKLRRCIS